jgi:hypothetical protein
MNITFNLRTRTKDKTSVRAKRHKDCEPLTDADQTYAQAYASCAVPKRWTFQQD